MRALLRNLRRAGVAKNRSSTSTWVPAAPAQGTGSPTLPPSTRSCQAPDAPGGREIRQSRAAAPIEGSASPRKPRVAMRTSVSSLSLEVQCRCTASSKPSGVMPLPSSVTTMRAMPPASRRTAMRRAPASIAFSTSSLTAAAGRSITSPAAMRLTTCSESRRIGDEATYSESRRIGGGAACSAVSGSLRGARSRGARSEQPVEEAGLALLDRRCGTVGRGTAQGGVFLQSGASRRRHRPPSRPVRPSRTSAR